MIEKIKTNRYFTKVIGGTELLGEGAWEFENWNGTPFNCVNDGETIFAGPCQLKVAEVKMLKAVGSELHFLYFTDPVELAKYAENAVYC